MAVTVNVILEHKGEEVVTIGTGASITEAARVLAEHNIGALVVSEDGETVAGILSERDIVRRLVDAGADCLHLAVGDVMTPNVAACTRDDNVDDLMATMTEHRIRHLPVLEDGRLVGIVSIGDVVKSRIDDLEIQAEHLKDYVTGSAY